MEGYNIVIGEIVEFEDKQKLGRYKVKIKSDGNKAIDKIPWSYPLMPKYINILPKPKEAVLVLLSTASNFDDTRYFIGPIISQPQNAEFDPYLNGNGSTDFITNPNSGNIDKSIDLFPETRGSFPDKKDISIIGRKSEDIILKNNEIDLRCGIRTAAVGNDKSFRGDIIYNNNDPSYIQLKHSENLSSEPTMEANSVVNIVADKINFIGHNRYTVSPESKTFNATSRNEKTDELLSDEDIRKIMKGAQSAVFGEVLVDVLSKMRSAIISHVHPYPGCKSIEDDDIKALEKINLDDIKSNNVRLN